MKPLSSTITLGALLFSVCCNSEVSRRSPVSSSPANGYHLPDQITVTAWAVRDLAGGTVVQGTTNLPDGTKLGVEVLDEARTAAQDFNIFVDSGNFHSAGFRKGTLPLPPGKHRFHILSHFNSNWQTEAILNEVGKGGSKLRALGVIRSGDTQLIDADKFLDYTVDLIVPPFLTPSPQKGMTPSPHATEADQAIAVVKSSVLVVDGRRSSETVESGALFYFKAPGIRMGNGWSAKPIGQNSYRVSLDFISVVKGTEQHDSALWDVNLGTKNVLYRNKAAKWFSWIPKD